MKLKVELFRYETLVFGKIIEQEGINRGCGKICEKNEYSIYSVESPAIDTINNKTLFIRGDQCKRIIFQYIVILIAKEKQLSGAKILKN